MFDHLGHCGFVIRLTWMGKKGFAILLAADCKSAGLKEVGAFLDDGLQIRRNERWLALYFLHTLIHFFPIYQSLACFIEFHCQGDDLALVGLEWCCVALFLYLALGSRNAAIVR